MWRVTTLVVAVVGAVLLVGCSTGGSGAGSPAGAEAPQKPVVAEVTQVTQTAASGLILEAEAFAVEGAKIVELKGASGGKAILFDTDTGKATLTVSLKKGTYEVLAYCQGVDEDRDAFYVSVGTYEERLFPDEYGKVVAAKPFRVVVGQDGPCKVIISAAEPNVHVDRLVLKQVQ